MAVAAANGSCSRGIEGLNCVHGGSSLGLRSRSNQPLVHMSAMVSYSIPTLLTRNLHDVFGETYPGRRRTAIDQIFAEDCVFYDPSGDVYRGRRDRSRGGRDKGCQS